MVACSAADCFGACQVLQQTLAGHGSLFGLEIHASVVRLILSYVHVTRPGPDTLSLVPTAPRVCYSSAGGVVVSHAHCTLPLCTCATTDCQHRVVAVCKPCGFTVDEAAACVQRRVPQASCTVVGCGKWAYVHQIDRHITGVLVGSHDHVIRAELTAQLRKRRVAKTYVALVKGQLPLHTSEQSVSRALMVIDKPLLGEHAQTLVYAVAHVPAHAEIEPAKTNAPSRHPVTHTASKQAGARTLVLLRPLTGRHHQLRKHLIAIGHDIVTFGSKRHKRILLHSAAYRFCPLFLRLNQLDRVEKHDKQGRASVHEPRLDDWDDHLYVPVRRARGFTVSGPYPEWLHILWHDPVVLDAVHMSVSYRAFPADTDVTCLSTQGAWSALEALFDRMCDEWVLSAHTKNVKNDDQL